MRPIPGSALKIIVMKPASVMFCVFLSGHEPIGLFHHSGKLSPDEDSCMMWVWLNCISVMVQ